MFPFSFPVRQSVVEEFKRENGVYLGDLDNGISEELLYLDLKDCGTLKYLKLHRYPFLGTSRQFAFAYYENEEQAQKALKYMNHRKVLKMPIRATPIPVAQRDKQANLLFMGFRADVNLTAVDEFFRKWGSVFSVKFSYDENKVNRGYGWVQFQDVEGATACIAEHDLEKLLKYVDVKGEHKITV
jgi:polyadenylate-binding protein